MKELKPPVHQPEDAGDTPAHGESIAVRMFETPIPLVRGRPPKAEGERKGRNLTFRVRDNLRERLQQAAEVNGRSISEEIEYRVETTFRSQDSLIRELAGPEAEVLVLPLLFLFSAVKARGIHLLNDPAAVGAMRQAIDDIAEAALSKRVFNCLENRDLEGDAAPQVAEIALRVLQTFGLDEKSPVTATRSDITGTIGDED